MTECSSDRVVESDADDERHDAYSAWYNMTPRTVARSSDGVRELEPQNARRRRLEEVLETHDTAEALASASRLAAAGHVLCVRIRPSQDGAAEVHRVAGWTFSSVHRGIDVLVRAPRDGRSRPCTLRFRWHSTTARRQGRHRAAQRARICAAALSSCARQGPRAAAVGITAATRTTHCQARTPARTAQPRRACTRACYDATLRRRSASRARRRWRRLAPNRNHEQLR